MAGKHIDKKPTNEQDTEQNTNETLNITTNVDHPATMNLFAEDRGNFAESRTKSTKTRKTEPARE